MSNDDVGSRELVARQLIVKPLCVMFVSLYWFRGHRVKFLGFLPVGQQTIATEKRTGIFRDETY